MARHRRKKPWVVLVSITESSGSAGLRWVERLVYGEPGEWRVWRRYRTAVEVWRALHAQRAKNRDARLVFRVELRD